MKPSLATDHKHWPHILGCVILCLILHFGIEALEYDDTSRHIADLQEQIDVLCIRLDMQDSWHYHPGPVADSLRFERLDWDR